MSGIPGDSLRRYAEQSRFPPRPDHASDDATADQLPLFIAGLVEKQLLEVVGCHGLKLLRGVGRDVRFSQKYVTVYLG